MNKKTASVLVGILVIGIVSAGLVPYLSNMVSASVEVSGPVFYAGKTAEEDFKLWISDFDKFQEENEGTWTKISGTEQKTFFTEVLEEMSFYAPEIEMQVEAKLIEGSPPKKLRVEFGYFDTSPDGSIFTIGDCITEVNITSTEGYEKKSITCQGDSEIPSLRGFYYRIEGRGTGGVEINIRFTDGETKAQILGVAQ